MQDYDSKIRELFSQLDESDKEKFLTAFASSPEDQSSTALSRQTRQKEAR